MFLKFGTNIYSKQHICKFVYMQICICGFDPVLLYGERKTLFEHFIDAVYVCGDV
jgi:hypothetical protein